MATKVEKLEFEGSQYEIIPPAPTSTERGGIIASAKTSDYTTEVKLGSDGKLYVPEGGGVGSLSDLGITATATELNYVDGVTSGVQGQLDDINPFKGVFNSGNIDELMTYGVYWVQLNKNSTTITGTQPPYVNTQFGYFEVLKAYKAGTDCMQRFTEYFGGCVHTRVFVNGGWIDWKTYNLDDFLPLSGGTMNKDAAIKWASKSSKNPYMGYSSTGSDDGTFVIASLTGTTYNSGLSIGGSSGNLLWKGKKVAVETAGGSWSYTKVIDSKYVGTVSTPVSSHQYFAAKGTVNGNVFTNTINLGDIGLWGTKSFSFAHGSSSCNFDITATSIKVTANGSVDDVSGYYMDK